MTLATDTHETSLLGMIRSLPQRAARRADSWMSTLQGIGQGLVDKVGCFTPAPFWRIPDHVLEDLFHGDAIVRKVITKRTDEALRLGFRVSMPEEAGGHESATAIQDAADDLDLVGEVRKACYWENLFGGSVLYTAIDDGQYSVDSQALPVRRDRIRRILWTRAIDRTRIRPSFALDDIDQDPESTTYGQPLWFLLRVRGWGDRAEEIRVHRSRLVIFPGAVCTDAERRRREGWGLSILEPIYAILQRNAAAWQSAANAIANSGYVVYKLRGLDRMFSMQGGEERAKARARAMEMAKSVISAVLIDADDEYIREDPSFGQLPQMLEQFQLDLAAALDMPATILWGRSPAGMNATGKSDLEHWYTSVDAYREHHLRPRLHEFLTLLMLSREGPTAGKLPDGWRVTFPPLHALSELERADLRLKTSQADASDITQGILMPQEVALSRFRPEGYSPTTQIDLDLRERLQAAELELREKQLENELERADNPPEPVPPGTPPEASGEREEAAE